MISCIVAHYSEEVRMKNEDMFREVFHGDRLEIDQHEDGMTLIFIYGAEKIKVWQAVLNLEVDQISVGFGFGANKEEARKEALERLRLISIMKIH